ncbi:MAG: microcin transport system permease protein [Rhodospirillaceae bacterium]|jgi:microcin C transport system permease protein|nr:microcin transport system permease protein [Rhodospirillaceae bacterium]
MFAYLIRRLLLIIPTLFGIMALNFFIMQVAPGGPVEQLLARLQGNAQSATANITGGGSEVMSNAGSAGNGPAGSYRGARGLDPAFIERIKKQYGFDKPIHVRFFLMLRSYATFDFGKSFFRDTSVMDLVIEKMPVSISIGLWTTLITYLVSIPLGIAKAVRDGTRFDSWTTSVVTVGNAIPSFLFAILLIVLFAGGRYFQWFPLRGLVSDDWASLSWPARIGDYFWHLALPLAAMLVGSFATLTMLTKNSFLEQINQQYVMTARAKGLTERRVLYGHIFRNAMLIVIGGFPAAFIGVLFGGAFLIETIFSLDGLGLLSYDALIQRDYPVLFANLYIFSLIGLVMNIIGDFTYTLVDPRLDFESRAT